MVGLKSTKELRERENKIETHRMKQKVLTKLCDMYQFLKKWLGPRKERMSYCISNNREEMVVT